MLRAPMLVRCRAEPSELPNRMSKVFGSPLTVAVSEPDRRAVPPPLVCEMAPWTEGLPSGKSSKLGPLIWAPAQWVDSTEMTPSNSALRSCVRSQL